MVRKMGARSIVVEDVLERSDILEELGHLEASSDLTGGDVTACAVTFLRCGVRRDRDANRIESNAVIGQVTIITFPTAEGKRSYVFEAILRLPGSQYGTEPLLNNHVPISSELALSFMGVTHTIPSSYFCQQNGLTSICPHSAVRTLIRTMTSRSVSVPQLNESWRYDPRTRKVTTVQVGHALREFGDLRAIPYDPGKSWKPNLSEGWELPALLADSGSASLLVLSDGHTDHVIPVLGHTINSDEWHPIGTQLHKKGQTTVSSSSLWTDHLVMHDDMLGPYFCLSKAGLLPAKDAPLKPRLAIAILPEGVKVSPTQAEDFARQILGLLIREIAPTGFGQGRWWKHLSELRERQVFRTTLITRDEYIATLPDTTHTGQAKEVLAQKLPETMWMSEISVPNLFIGNRSKLGEVLVRADQFPPDTGADPLAVLNSLAGFRLPSIISWPVGIDGDLSFEMMRWPEREHRPIYAPKHHRNWW
ncbi:hypothetical protein GR702_20825 [Novosphingobium sp. FGD1]|uniref:Uncharacterized protein n=1 Tax=Novosphingobium silvae TaxID=2692619 RepID=A0A7X4GM57_9SPHN|nr:hypothetical protein [Novosphingobium silvae]MYM00200.1 hypothetical protein [Novosphingobium silvae]